MLRLERRETDMERGRRTARERAIWHWQIQRWVYARLPYIWLGIAALLALWVAAIARSAQ